MNLAATVAAAVLPGWAAMSAAAAFKVISPSPKLYGLAVLLYLPKTETGRLSFLRRPQTVHPFLLLDN